MARYLLYLKNSTDEVRWSRSPSFLEGFRDGR
jgi:hypothetical protein